ncbi:aldehyde dehydrogenase family protein [Sphingobium sp. Sx8-8]|uniref:aldehyde dehydrogenase family protein n=1 Tax=Sphingobium sp. Sx8-8 TaxID=2933617 RepID=UPI001F5790C6|nr:aldehyde dehydrogenase family protein [Sphingobium sp. Sx8-8]
MMSHAGENWERRLLIDGELVEGAMQLPVIDPATGEPFLSVARASPAQAEGAIAAARSAWPAWAARPHEERQACLVQLADAIAAHADELARALTREQGKPFAEAQGEIAWAEGYVRHYATLDLPGRTIRDDAEGLAMVRYRPLGVVAGIVAWNFPVLLACWKIAPAVLAGNSVILKPAPTTPLTALMIGALCRDIFPAGIVNILVDDNDLGPVLTTHPDIAKISFTGSTATGRRIMAGAAGTLKRLTLELGGNDPAIVLDDVDVSSVARQIFAFAFINCGQVCLAIKRVYVDAAIHDALCGELTQLAREAVVGEGMEQGTTIGPIQNRAQFEKIRAFVEQARMDGTILAGGDVLERSGYFITPAIVRDVTDGDQIVDEEQFGPILPIVRFDDIDAVVDRVNASPQGLGGSIWSASTERALAIADRIETGTIWVNQHLAIGPHIPMAGFRQSGIGVEQAEEGLKEFMQIQALNVARQP